jgi:hypothetical protein
MILTKETHDNVESRVNSAYNIINGASRMILTTKVYLAKHAQ